MKCGKTDRKAIKKIRYMNQVSPWATLDYVTKNMKTNYTYLGIFTRVLMLGFKNL